MAFSSISILFAMFVMAIIGSFKFFKDSIYTLTITTIVMVKFVISGIIIITITITITIIIINIMAKIIKPKTIRLVFK